MKFRPCIDIHNGSVKQIVGGSLKDEGNAAIDNFVSEYDGAFYAKLYKNYGLTGGHIILLNSKDSEYYEKTKEQAMLALRTYPMGLQIGGGITDENAMEYIEAGASHVIVTSYVFKDGKINFENLKKISDKVGKERLVIDLSCRKKDGHYYIVTDRWQKFTDMILDEEAVKVFAEYCDEFLIHAVDVEGKANGIDSELTEMLGNMEDVKITYAGGISSMTDLDILKEKGREKIDFTIGSALDIFGGKLKFDEIAQMNM